MKENNSRKDILVRNTKFGIIRTLLQYILQFVLRTVMIYTLGVEYLGVSGLFANVIGCLSIVELGMGTAIVYSMYKPIAENNVDKIKSLHNLYKKIYVIIALIIMVVGLAITPLIPYFIESGAPAEINIYLVYLIFLFNTVVGYFAAHKRSLLFAYQRNDVESKIRITSLIALYSAEILMLISFKNYYAYVICLPIFTIFESVLVYIYANKLFPNIKGKSNRLDSDTKKEIFKNITALSMHQLGGVLVLSTDSLIMSAMLGLTILGVYSNYAALITCVTAIVTLLTSTAQSTIGNLIAAESKEYVEEKFKAFNFMMLWIVGFCSIALFCLLNPFVLIWTGSVDYVMSISIVLIIVFNFYISNSLSLSYTLNIAAGLMRYSKWKPIVQGITNIVASILLTKWLGPIGIFLGTLLSYLIMPVWIEPYVSYKHYFQKSSKEYWFKYITFMALTFIIGVATYMICSILPAVGILWFILKAVICLAIPNLCYIIIYGKTTEFKEIFALIKRVILKVVKKK